MELLKRNYKRRNDRNVFSISSLSETFLLHISLISFCHYVYLPIILLNELMLFKVNHLFLYVLHSPSFTAVPLFLVAICVDCYVAVVHPVAYLAVKNLPHRVLLCTTPVWVYTLVIWLISVIYQLSYFHPVCMMSFYVSLPAVVFFSISTLRALYSAKPGSSNQTLSPTKRRAFWIILSILVGMVVYYMPQVCFFTYRFIEPTDSERLACLEIPLVMLLPSLCKSAAPLLHLYCVDLHVCQISGHFLDALYCPCLSALPLFLVAICVDCYLAVVHPVAYMAIKNTRHRPLLCTAPVWVYAFVIWLITVIYNLNYYHPVCMMSFYVSLPAVMFFSISTLRVLYSAKPGSSNQTLSPAKRRAFRIILSILVGMVVYYMPQRSLVMALYRSTLTAGHVFLAVICVDCHCAVVHPVAYIARKAWRIWAPLYCMVIWAYAMGIGVTMFCLDLPIVHPICLVTFYLALSVVIVCSVSILRTLFSARPGNSSQTPSNLNPTKRRAFWVILSVLVLTVVCFLPQLVG
ncbi:hypothetical protein MHYP_G00151320 [Metynnis hypsauchen]